MSLRISAALTMALAVSGVATDAAPAADPFAACREQFARAPEQYESSYCFYQVALDRRLPDEAARAFEGLIEKHPTNFWLPLAYGHLYRDRSGATDRAERLYQTAAAGFRRSGHAEGEILARSNLRNFLFPTGRVRDATREVERVAEIAAAAADPLLKARAWTLQATHIQDSGGDLALAYRLLQQTEGAVFPSGPYRLQRTTLISLGLVAFRLGRFDEALTIFHRLDDLAASAGEKQVRANAQYNILNTSSLQESLLPTPGGKQRLIRLAEQALATAVDAQNRGSMAKIHRTLAELLARDEGTRPMALQHADACVTLAAAIRVPHDEADCSWIKASLLARSDPVKSREAERRAMDATARANSPRTRAYSAGRRMRLSWETNSRPQAIRDSLGAIDAIESLRSLQDESERSAEFFSTWTLDYYWLSGRLLDDGREEDVPRAFSITERMRARALLDTLHSKRGAREPAFAELDTIQSALAEDEAMLSFQIGLWETFDGDFGGGSWVVVVTRHGRSVHRLPDRARLAATVPVFTGLLARADGLEAASAARLYAELLSDAVRGLPTGVVRLIIIPDGALHHLPFDALRPSAQSLPLAARYQLVVAPSATLWRDWRMSARTETTGRALVFADPTQDFGRLPYARQESRALQRHIGDVDALVGTRASERALKGSDLRRYDILHLAAHAISDEAHPERSAVLLSPGGDSEDGRLHAREIEGLDLDGQVVVLSACRTVSGTIVSGEGVLSLARAFFQARARTVIGTRWPIRDEDAASFFDLFYRRLGEGRSLSDALMLAKREAIAEGRPPAVWASIVLLGDGEFRPFAGRRIVPTPARWPSQLIAVALLLAAGGYGTARRLHRKRF